MNNGQPQRILLSFFLLALPLCQALGQDVTDLTTQDQEHLVQFLQHYVSDPTTPPDHTARFAAKSVKLTSGQHRQIVVYILGSMICGSGGCPTLVLEPAGSSFRTVGEISITHPPIRLLRTSTHGWRDLSVFVAGGGIHPGYDALLPFDGDHYSSNPTDAPSRRLNKKVEGDMIIPSYDTLENLYSEKEAK